jgi:hypothetical protein
MYNTGNLYPRWNKGIDVMLLKASGITLAHKKLSQNSSVAGGGLQYE